MEHSFEGEGNGLAIRINGRMTHSDYKGFREILAHINQERPPRVVFDLAQVDFVDSSALGMLLIVRDAAVQDQREVVLRGATGQVLKLIDIGKLRKYFTVE